MSLYLINCMFLSASNPTDMLLPLILLFCQLDFRSTNLLRYLAQVMSIGTQFSPSTSPTFKMAWALKIQASQVSISLSSITQSPEAISISTMKLISQSTFCSGWCHLCPKYLNPLPWEHNWFQLMEWSETCPVASLSFERELYVFTAVLVCRYFVRKRSR